MGRKEELKESILGKIAKDVYQKPDAEILGTFQNNQ